MESVKTSQQRNHYAQSPAAQIIYDYRLRANPRPEGRQSEQGARIIKTEPVTARIELFGITISHIHQKE